MDDHDKMAERMFFSALIMDASAAMVAAPEAIMCPDVVGFR